MPTDPATHVLPEPPKIPSGKEIYDSIMQEIEPELTTEGVSLLPQKYQNETPEAARARAERYKRAWHVYKERFDTYKSELHEKVKRYSKQTVTALEDASKNAEALALEEIEKLMGNTSSLPHGT